MEVNTINTTDDTIVIIGAGTVGLFLANLLIQANKKIIIIEAGNDNIESFKDNEYEVVGLPHTGVAIGRTKAIGGTSICGVANWHLLYPMILPKAIFIISHNGQ